MRLISFSFIFVMLGLSSLAGTLLKQDGVSLKGKVELLESGKINVGSVTILPAEVQLLEFDQPPSIESTNELDRLTLGLMAVEIPGALSVGGTYIARPVIALDETKLTFEGDPEGIFLSTVNTAAVFFAPLSLGQSEELRNRKPGLMLRSGDFVEGKPLKLKKQNARRTAIGVLPGGDQIVIAVVDRPVLTEDLAKHMAGTLGCTHALNLDGGTSTQLWSALPAVRSVSGFRVANAVLVIRR